MLCVCSSEGPSLLLRLPDGPVWTRLPLATVAPHRALMMSLLSLPGRGLAMGPLAVHFLAPLH